MFGWPQPYVHACIHRRRTLVNVHALRPRRVLTWRPNACPKALTDSVLPVPAGPYGFPPNPICIPCKYLRQHRRRGSNSRTYIYLTTAADARFSCSRLWLSWGEIWWWRMLHMLSRAAVLPGAWSKQTPPASHRSRRAHPLDRYIKLG